MCSSCFVAFTSAGSKDLPVSGKGFKKPASRSLGEPPVNMQTPDKPTILKPPVSQTEPRHMPLSRFSWRILLFSIIWLIPIILKLWRSKFGFIFDPLLLPCRIVLCKTPGCFLPSLSNPANGYNRNFKQKKEELTSRLYQLYNTSVFDNKVLMYFYVYFFGHFLKCPPLYSFHYSYVLWLTASGQYASDLE